MTPPELEIDYLENGSGPGITELPSSIERPPAEGERGVVLDAPPGWEREHIEAMLKGIGAGVHLLLGQNEREWLMTKEDLERMAPPATRIANRWEPSRRASEYADPLLFSYGAVLYAWRNALTMKRRQKDQRAAAPVSDATYEYPDDVVDAGDDAGEAPGRAPYFPESPRAGGSI